MGDWSAIESEFDSLCDQLVRFRLQDISPQALENALFSFVDTIGVGIAGAKTQTAERVRKWLMESYRHDGCRIFGSSLSLPTAGAAFANAASCHALDYDDTCYDGIVHASTAALPAAFAASETFQCSGQCLFESYIVGCQAAVEIGRILSDAFYQRGWFNTAILGAIAAAAASVYARGGTQAEMRAALALCLTDIGATRSVLGVEAKPFLLGKAVEDGVRFADIVALGFSVPDRPWLHPFGFVSTKLQLIPRVPHPRSGALCFEAPGMALKLFPVCSAAQSATECLRDLLVEERIEASAIRSIHVGATQLVVDSLRYSLPRTTQEAQFSMPFALACILRHGQLGPSELDIDKLSDPALHSFMQSISLATDPALETARERADQAPEAARLTITMHDGDVVEAVHSAASGMPSNPFSVQQLRQKFLDNCAFAALSSRRGELLFEQCLHIAEIEHPSVLPI